MHERRVVREHVAIARDRLRGPTGNAIERSYARVEEHVLHVHVAGGLDGPALQVVQARQVVHVVEHVGKARRRIRLPTGKRRDGGQRVIVVEAALERFHQAGIPTVDADHARETGPARGGPVVSEEVLEARSGARIQPAAVERLKQEVCVEPALHVDGGKVAIGLDILDIRPTIEAAQELKGHDFGVGNAVGHVDKTRIRRLSNLALGRRAVAIQAELARTVCPPCVELRVETTAECTGAPSVNARHGAAAALVVAVHELAPRPQPTIRLALPIPR